MATEQYENTPVNNVQARRRAVVDNPNDSDVEIVNADSEMRDGGEDRSNMANETAADNTGNPEDDKDDDAEYDALKRAQIMYSEVLIEQNDIIIAYLKENTKLQQKMINCVADSEVEFEELSLDDDAPTREVFRRCKQDSKGISMKGTAKKMSFVMMNVSDVYGSNDYGDDGDDATNETLAGSTSAIRKDSGTVTPDAKTSLQASNVNMK